MAKLFLISESIFRFLSEQRKHNSRGHWSQSRTSRRDSPFLGQWIGWEAAGCYCRILHQEPEFFSLSTQSPSTSFEKVLSVYWDLYDRVNRQKAMSATGHIYFNELLNFTWENTAMCMFQDRPMLQKYLKVMPIFCYDANNTRRLWKNKNYGRLEWSLEKAKAFLFLGAEYFLASLITVTLIRSSRKHGKHCSPVDIIFNDFQEPEDRRTGLIARSILRDGCSFLFKQRPLLFVLLRLHPFLFQLVQSSLMHQERVQMRKQQRMFEDTIPDIIPSNWSDLRSLHQRFQQL